MRELTLENTSAIHVARLLPSTQALRHIRGFTEEKDLTNVMNAIRLLARIHNFGVTRELILERNLINVMSAAKPLQIVHILIDIR